MDKRKSNLKRMFMLNIRIGFLIAIVSCILGFIFLPEFGTNPYQPRVEHVIKVDDIISPVDVVKIPPPPRVKLPVEAESDDVVEEETIPVTIFTDDGKEPVIEFEPPPFVPYDVEPELLNLNEVKFKYPKSVRMLGVEGTVYLELWIDKEGNVRNVKLVKSLYSTLDKIAVQNAKNLKFSPAMQRDKPVAVRYSFPVKFKLQ
jgi:protein TonB